MIGTTELIIIVVVVLILFGARTIPRLARSLGRAKKEFEDGLKEGQGNEEDKGKGEAPGAPDAPSAPER